MKELWCISGGGMSGMDKLAGMAMAAWDAGLRPTALTGTSAGAMVAGLIANGWEPNSIGDFFQGLTDDLVREERFAWKARFFWLDHIMGNSQIQRLIASTLPQDFTDLALPLQVVATRLKTNHATWFGHPVVHAPLRQAVLASMAIHGVFPEVEIYGELYADGGTRANLPLPSNWETYDRVVLFAANPPMDYEPRGSRVLGKLIHNMHSALMDQTDDIIDRVGGHPKVIVVRPDCGRKSGTLRFDHGLIATAYREARPSIETQLRQQRKEHV